MKHGTRDLFSYYPTHPSRDEEAILSAAEDIFRRRLERAGSITTPTDAADFLRARLAGLGHEEVHALWLDSRHRILDIELLARGSIAGAEVHPPPAKWFAQPYATTPQRASSRTTTPVASPSRVRPMSPSLAGSKMR